MSLKYPSPSTAERVSPDARTQSRVEGVGEECVYIIPSVDRSEEREGGFTMHVVAVGVIGETVTVGVTVESERERDRVHHEYGRERERERKSERQRERVYRGRRTRRAGRRLLRPLPRQRGTT